MDGNAEDLYKECEDYELSIKEAGGIDLFLGGIGAGELVCPLSRRCRSLWILKDGHVAFNEVSGSNFQERLLTFNHLVARIITLLPNPNQDPSVRNHPCQLPILQQRLRRRPTDGTDGGRADRHGCQGGRTGCDGAKQGIGLESDD